MAVTWPLPTIKGTQIGLKNPGHVDVIKQLMKTGRFPYVEERIGGVRDPHGAYYVLERHHRMVAAMEIYSETGDSGPLQALLGHGKWDLVPIPPIDARPMPARRWWASFRNWLGY